MPGLFQPSCKDESYMIITLIILTVNLIILSCFKYNGVIAEESFNENIFNNASYIEF